MKRDNILIVLGVLVFLLTFIGIPDVWTSALISICGVGVIALSASRRLQAKVKKDKSESPIFTDSHHMAPVIEREPAKEISPEPLKDLLIEEDEISKASVAPIDLPTDEHIIAPEVPVKPAKKPRAPRAKKSKKEKTPEEKVINLESNTKEEANYEFIEADQVVVPETDLSENKI